ncbi:MAG TPA: branched-chain amino acid ABC transporter permease [Terrimesophilobacter sp.]|nr:branched-chain amino acid ABC transporter permease [Terrimesophilobacter sp.]
MNPAITALWVTAAFGGVAALAVLSPSGMQGFAQAVSDGLRLGLIIALIGMGLSLVFATSGVFNFAHGEFATLGALSAWWLNAIVGVPLILAIAIAVVIGAIVGVGSERGLWRPLRHRGVSLTSTLVVAIGLGLASRNLFLFIFGGGSVSYSEYTVQQTISVLGVDMLPKQIVSEMICIAALVGVGIFLKVSSTGQSIRAVADDQVLAGASGIEVNRTLTIVWALGGAMAALGGALLGLFQQIDWAMGNELLLLIIAGVTLGGLDTVKGAVIGSVLVGIVTQVSVLFLPAELKYMTALAILILILLLRPQGIFGRRRRVG